MGIDLLTGLGLATTGVSLVDQLITSAARRGNPILRGAQTDLLNRYRTLRDDKPYGDLATGNGGMFGFNPEGDPYSTPEGYANFLFDRMNEPENHNTRAVDRLTEFGNNLAIPGSRVNFGPRAPRSGTVSSRATATADGINSPFAGDDVAAKLGKLLPQYAAGTNRVQGDQLAIVHDGEAIVPADENPLNSALAGGQQQKGFTQAGAMVSAPSSGGAQGSPYANPQAYGYGMGGGQKVGNTVWTNAQDFIPDDFGPEPGRQPEVSLASRGLGGPQFIPEVEDQFNAAMEEGILAREAAEAEAARQAEIDAEIEARRNATLNFNESAGFEVDTNSPTNPFSGDALSIGDQYAHLVDEAGFDYDMSAIQALLDSGSGIDFDALNEAANAENPFFDAVSDYEGAYDNLFNDVQGQINAEYAEVLRRNRDNAAIMGNLNSGVFQNDQQLTDFQRIGDIAEQKAKLEAESLGFGLDVADLQERSNQGTFDRLSGVADLQASDHQSQFNNQLQSMLLDLNLSQGDLEQALEVFRVGVDANNADVGNQITEDTTDFDQHARVQERYDQLDEWLRSHEFQTIMATQGLEAVDFQNQLAYFRTLLELGEINEQQMMDALDSLADITAMRV